MKLKSIFMVIGLLFIAISSESATELSRAKAKDILRISKMDPIIKGFHLGARKIEKRQINNKPFKIIEEKDEKELNALAKAGYIVISEFINKDYDGETLMWKIEITDILNPYIVNTSQYMGVYYLKLKIAEIAVDKITGITSHPVDASAKFVEYTVITKPNSLGEVYLNLGSKDITNTPIKKNAIFKLYDDGWRIAN